MGKRPSRIARVGRERRIVLQAGYAARPRPSTASAARRPLAEPAEFRFVVGREIRRARNRSCPSARRGYEVETDAGRRRAREEQRGPRRVRPPRFDPNDIVEGHRPAELEDGPNQGITLNFGVRNNRDVVVSCPNGDQTRIELRDEGRRFDAPHARARRAHDHTTYQARAEHAASLSPKTKCVTHDSRRYA
jgi:hypothetical protein